MRILPNFATLIILCTSALTATAQVQPGSTVLGSFEVMAPGGSLEVWEFFNSSATPGVNTWSRTHARASVFGDTSNMGVIKMLSYASRTAEGGRAKANVSGGFEDVITISDPTRTGQTGTFNGRIHLEMDNEAFGPKDYNYANTFGLSVSDSMANARGAWQGFGGYAFWYQNYDSAPATDVDTYVNFSITFTFGQPFSIGVWMSSSAATGYGGGSFYGGEAVSILHDATHTAEWGGIVSIMDNTGTPIAGGYSMTSASGTNYVQAIPEPSSSILIALGAVGIAALRRRRLS